jgi:23S rRNA (pseudouridine1915-N3)-methyltransferase
VKITLICIGRLREDAERKIVARYTERFQQTGAQAGFPALSIVELPESRAATAKARKAAEAAELRKKIAAGAPPIIALDERGGTLTSSEFADKLGAWRDSGVKNLAIVIGGPDGLDADLVKEAGLVLSLGRLTMPHGLARAVLAEQLYRAATILTGHPYHRV